MMITSVWVSLSISFILPFFLGTEGPICSHKKHCMCSCFACVVTFIHSDTLWRNNSSAVALVSMSNRACHHITSPTSPPSSSFYPYYYACSIALLFIALLVYMGKWKWKMNLTGKSLKLYGFWFFTFHIVECMCFSWKTNSIAWWDELLWKLFYNSE